MGHIESVSPNNGPLTGGNDVTITGFNLGSGSDIITVSLAGVPAPIRSQSAQSVVVTAGQATVASSGAVILTSPTVGTTQLADGYRYNARTCCCVFFFVLVR